MAGNYKGWTGNHGQLPVRLGSLLPAESQYDPVSLHRLYLCLNKEKGMNGYKLKIVPRVSKAHRPVATTDADDDVVSIASDGMSIGVPPSRLDTLAPTYSPPQFVYWEIARRTKTLERLTEDPSAGRLISLIPSRRPGQK